MQYINITEAKATLSALLEKVINSGEDVIIGKMGKPMVKISKYESSNKKNRIGVYKDKIKILGNIDEWPEDMKEFLGMD